MQTRYIWKNLWKSRIILKGVIKMPKLNEILGEESFKQLPEEIRKKYKDIDLVDRDRKSVV